MWPFVLFALFLTLFMLVSFAALAFTVTSLASTLTEAHAEALELFKARSLEEKVVLDDRKEAATEARKVAMEELKELAKQPKKQTLAETTDGRFVDAAHLVPDFQE